jgi:hypothetical protein
MDVPTTRMARLFLSYGRRDAELLADRLEQDLIERDLYRFDRLQVFPPGLKGLYLDFFQRRFPDEARYDATRKELQAVVAAAEPLSDDELARAASLDTGTRARPLWWRRSVQELREVLLLDVSCRCLADAA